MDKSWQGPCAYSEKVIKALGISTELGQVVYETVALLIGEQVHQVAGVHSCRETPYLGCHLTPVSFMWDWGSSVELRSGQGGGPRSPI